jgi:YD repeat-containing protein
MKLTASTCIFSTLVFFLISCQKQYDRPDITGTGGSGTSGGTATTSGKRLVKYEAKVKTSPEGNVSTYLYDPAGRLIRINSTDTDSLNISTSSYYRFVRNADGNITSIVTNSFAAENPGLGFPDSISVAVHYPAGSSNFDYTVFNIKLSSGLPVIDSMVFIYSNGVITDRYDYQAVGTTTKSLISREQFIYNAGSTNLTGIKVYAVSGTTQTLSGTYSYELDDKAAVLYMGNEAFLRGLDVGMFSKNNIQKMTVTDISTNTLLALTQYNYQYNSNNQPTIGTTLTVWPGNKVANVSYTYE